MTALILNGNPWRTFLAHFLLVFGAQGLISPKTHHPKAFHSKRSIWKH